MHAQLNRRRAECSPGRRAANARLAALAWLALLLPACEDSLVGENDPAGGDDRSAASARPERTLEVAGGTFDLFTAGPPAGEVVLLLHDFDGAQDVHAALPRVANAGYRAIAVVRRDAAPQAVVDPARAARQALALADALALTRFHVAGDRTAWDLAKLIPERVISVANARRGHPSAGAAHEAPASACGAGSP